MIYDGIPECIYWFDPTWIAFSWHNHLNYSPNPFPCGKYFSCPRLNYTPHFSPHEHFVEILTNKYKKKLSSLSKHKECSSSDIGEQKVCGRIESNLMNPFVFSRISKSSLTMNNHEYFGTKLHLFYQKWMNDGVAVTNMEFEDKKCIL